MAEKYFAQPGNDQAHFSRVPGAEIQRSKFDRSHGLKSTFDAGFLIPVYWDEVLPGDTFHMKSTAFCRMATPLKPIMDNLYLDTHFFFVPYRLCWEHWEQFMGQRDQPGDDPSVYSIPQTAFDTAAILPDDLASYFGIPHTTQQSFLSCSALPFRAYGLIWNEWYRDENLQDPLPVLLSDYPAQPPNFKCQRRGKRKDYFTSALPWPQKGSPVYVPLGEYADVVPNIQNPDMTFHTVAYPNAANLTTASLTGSKAIGYSGPVQDAGTRNLRWNNSGLVADLTDATAITINDLRTAFQIQKLLERDARGGTRYIELVLSHFGVQSDDARLQRPEFLGGGTTMLSVNPIASTVHTVDAPQANLASYVTGVGKAGFTKSFTEHGIIIGLVSARADLTYQQGLERFWSRHTRYDFYWPSLAHLGEQAILTKEIYWSGNATDNTVFGYQERYAEYRYKPSRITGLFNSQFNTSLDVWHLAQDFNSPPTLNGPFIREEPPIDRVIAVPSEPHFLLDMWFSLQCERPMPIYAVPGLIDHF